MWCRLPSRPRCRSSTSSRRSADCCRRRPQRRQRLRRRGRQAARQQPRVAKGGVHRRDHHRAADHAVRLGEHQPGHARASAASRRTSSWADVMDHDDVLRQCLEGSRCSKANQGEVCTCPSRALIHESILRAFIERALERVRAIVTGDPLDPATMIGAQASNDQFEDPQLPRDRQGRGCRGADRRRCPRGRRYEGGFYIEPTIFKGHNKMRIFREDLRPEAGRHDVHGRGRGAGDRQRHALRPGAGVWTRDADGLSPGARHPGRAGWTNC